MRPLQHFLLATCVLLVVHTSLSSSSRSTASDTLFRSHLLNLASRSRHTPTHLDDGDDGINAEHDAHVRRRKLELRRAHEFESRWRELEEEAEGMLSAAKLGHDSVEVGAAGFLELAASRSFDFDLVRECPDPDVKMCAHRCCEEVVNWGLDKFHCQEAACRQPESTVCERKTHCPAGYVCCAGRLMRGPGRCRKAKCSAFQTELSGLCKHAGECPHGAKCCYSKLGGVGRCRDSCEWDEVAGLGCGADSECDSGEKCCEAPTDATFPNRMCRDARSGSQCPQEGFTSDDEVSYAVNAAPFQPSRDSFKMRYKHRAAIDDDVWAMLSYSEVATQILELQQQATAKRSEAELEFIRMINRKCAKVAPAAVRLLQFTLQIALLPFSEYQLLNSKLRKSVPCAQLFRVDATMRDMPSDLQKFFAYLCPQVDQVSETLDALNKGKATADQVSKLIEDSSKWLDVGVQLCSLEHSHVPDYRRLREICDSLFERLYFGVTHSKRQNEERAKDIKMIKSIGKSTLEIASVAMSKATFGFSKLVTSRGLAHLGKKLDKHIEGTQSARDAVADFAAHVLVSNKDFEGPEVEGKSWEDVKDVLVKLRDRNYASTAQAAKRLIDELVQIMSCHNDKLESKEYELSEAEQLYLKRKAFISLVPDDVLQDIGTQATDLLAMASRAAMANDKHDPVEHVSKLVQTTTKVDVGTQTKSDSDDD